MKHKWNKQPNEDIGGYNSLVHICRVCGCKKTQANIRFSEPNYTRNKQTYDRYIECIDLDAENLKTID